MPIASTMSEVTRPCLPTDVPDDSCKLELIEIVPLTRVADDLCTKDGGDESAEVEQEILPVLKLDIDDVSMLLL